MKFFYKTKQIYQSIIMRWFSSPEKYIKWYLTKKHGSVQLSDETWAVNQSDEFYKWCRNEGYKIWKKS